ncbi:glycoside hydrolase family 81 protein [Xylona heveae TC161]|uniref:Glucan endo-1,3-beta-D-glucosidase 1 n=1 Tax=Xylona heveae (strain CBS 132557 / TC161) TaxID=1328760 RepID=A0A165IH24_XYLHT|nr:glycoside hydrolase family 81 protein [Xylona heveae TC161]KZF24885.1 glycoside hydrolase family 81 protein [Xylona heveae TC161]
MSSNIFVPVSTGALPSVIGSRPDHPVPRLGISNQSTPLSTNKFYANLFLGNQNQGAWTHPYSVSWAKGTGNAASWGLSVSHIEASQRAYGPGNPVQYFINPIGIQSMILSAVGLGSDTTLTTSELTAFSVNVHLSQSAGAPPAVTIPLVQGMGFITAIYSYSAPVIQSSVFFRSLSAVQSPQSGVAKYQVTLEDNSIWLIYLTASSGSPVALQQISNTVIQAPAEFNGTVQIAKVPQGNTTAQSTYDAAAGVYATTAQVSGSVSGSVGSYSLSWTKAGKTSNTLLMFALPHHVQSFSSGTKSGVTGIQLQTTTKGIATAVVADSWTLTESSLPTDMGFAPWSPSLRSVTSLSAAAIQLIQSVGASEVSQDMNAQTNLNSMYFSGKALSKFATIVYTLHDLGQRPDLAATGLASLKKAFALFASNQQQYPLVYETAWKGVVSTASYATNDSGADFGNTYYNDHHFHYGYFIHTAAVIGYLDPSWLAANQAWVNMLVRDVANPSTADPYFPVSRSFDWYHGHSWAKGLFESGDSKDEESSSEDAMCAYAIKMWGKTIGDANMEARGNLMLAILARTLHDYFLMESTNTIQPANFIGNKVTGILFENKIDHTTYFGTNPEYIEGIHMIPLNPSSALTRTQNFVSEEWATYFNNGRVDQVAGGWRGILYANLAIIDPVTSYNFFAQSNFDASWLDGGASRTWYLAYSAGECLLFNFFFLFLSLPFFTPADEPSRSWRIEMIAICIL